MLPSIQEITDFVPPLFLWNPGDKTTVISTVEPGKGVALFLLGPNEHMSFLTPRALKIAGTIVLSGKELRHDD
jgi:hypothetical protein